MDTGIVEEMSVLILSQAVYIDIGSLCARNTILDVLRWFPTETYIFYHCTEMVNFRQKLISDIIVTK